MDRPSYIYASTLTRRERAWRRRRQATAPVTAVVSALVAASALAAFVAHLFGV